MSTVKMFSYNVFELLHKAFEDNRRFMFGMDFQLDIRDVFGSNPKAGQKSYFRIRYTDAFIPTSFICTVPYDFITSEKFDVFNMPTQNIGGDNMAIFKDLEGGKIEDRVYNRINVAILCFDNADRANFWADWLSIWKDETPIYPANVGTAFIHANEHLLPNIQ